MTDIISPITDDEYTILEICHQGGAIAPIGRWEAPTKALESRGFLQRYDAMNYGITEVGMAALQSKEADQDKALSDAINKHAEIHQKRDQIQDNMRTCAAVFLAAARMSSIVTGESVETSIHKWADEVKRESLRMLEDERNATAFSHH